MNEIELKYGCNPNQKPSRIFMEDGSDLTGAGGAWRFVSSTVSSRVSSMVSSMPKSNEYVVFSLSNLLRCTSDIEPVPERSWDLRSRSDE